MQKINVITHVLYSNTYFLFKQVSTKLVTKNNFIEKNQKLDDIIYFLYNIKIISKNYILYL